MSDASPFINHTTVSQEAQNAGARLIRLRTSKQKYSDEQKKLRNPRYKKTGKL